MTGHDDANPVRERPEGVDDQTVEALGKVSEALEAIEIARGHLYTFHRLMGTADFTLGEGVDLLREAGHDDVADRLHGLAADSVRTEREREPGDDDDASDQQAG